MYRDLLQKEKLNLKLKFFVKNAGKISLQIKFKK